LPHTAATANPVDLAGAGEQDQQSFARTTRTLLEAPELDAVLFTSYFGGYSLVSDELRDRELAVVDAIAAAVAETGTPLVVHTMNWDTPPAKAFLAHDVAVYRHVESAVAALRALVRDAELRPAPLPALPEPAPPVAGADYTAARSALAAAGVPFGAARTVADADAARAAAAELGYPVVLKSLRAVHKSDAGGVVLGLADEAALTAALERLAPPWSVEASEDVAAGAELLVGARWDVRFGPIVVVGAGGIQAELLRDTAVALAPVDAGAAERLLRSLAIAPVLAGARGRPPLDVHAAAEAVAALSRF